jgi:hypothetical protein
LGIILYSQLETLSIAMTLVGLLATLIGGVIWACRAPIVWSLLSGLSIWVVALLLLELVNINVHGTTAMFLPVIFAAVISGALLLLIAAVRFVLSLRTRKH